MASSSTFNPTVADYKKVASNLRQTIAEQFPEVKNLYIIDETQPPENELARAAKALGIPNLAAQIKAQWKNRPGRSEKEYPRISGTAVTVMSPKGESANIVFGWGYYYKTDEVPTDTKIPEEMFLGLARVLTHETNHVVTRYLSPYKDFPYSERFEESFAILVAEDISTRNGISVPGRLDFRMAERESLAIQMPANKYDASVEIGLLKERHYSASSNKVVYRPNDFSGFANMRDSYERCQKIMLETRDRDEDVFPRKSMAAALQIAKGDLAEEFLSAKNSPEVDKKIDSKIMEWLSERQSIFPEYARAKAGKEYLAEYAKLTDSYNQDNVPTAQRVYPEYKPTFLRPSESFAKSVGAAWIKQSESNDPLDGRIARQLLQDLNKYAQQQKIGALDPLQLAALMNDTKNVAWAKRLVTGDPLKDVILQMGDNTTLSTARFVASLAQIDPPAPITTLGTKQFTNSAVTP